MLVCRCDVPRTCCASPGCHGGDSGDNGPGKSRRRRVLADRVSWHCRTLIMWKRILAATMFVSLLWVAGNTVTSYITKLVHESHARALVEDVATIRAGWAMQDSLWRMQATAMEAQTKSHRETLVEIAELEAAFDRQLQDAVDTCDTAKEEVLDRIVRDRFAL